MNNIQISNILRIQEASKQDKLVIFVGAGVSTNSGVPMWSKLIESLKDDLPESLKRETDDLKIAQLYKGEFYQFNLSSCIRQQNSLTAQFVSFSLANLANIFYPPDFYNN